MFLEAIIDTINHQLWGLWWHDKQRNLAVEWAGVHSPTSLRVNVRKRPAHSTLRPTSKFHQKSEWTRKWEKRWKDLLAFCRPYLQNPHTCAYPRNPKCLSYMGGYFWEASAPRVSSLEYTFLRISTRSTSTLSNVCFYQLLTFHFTFPIDLRVRIFQNRRSRIRQMAGSSDR